MKKIIKLSMCLAMALAFAAAPVTTVAGEAAQGNQTVAAAPSVKVQHGGVEINLPGDDNKTVTIYALTGQIVKHCTIAPGVTAIDLPAGYYIVKIDRTSMRIVVR